MSERRPSSFVEDTIVDFVCLVGAGAIILSLILHWVFPVEPEISVSTSQAQAGSSEPQRETHAWLVDGAAIPRVICRTAADEMKAGSGFWIDEGRVAVASHVISDRKCWVNGRPATVLLNDRDKDFAIITGINTTGVVAPRSCDGLQPGRTYLMAGYANGKFLRILPVIATSMRSKDPDYRGMVVMYGGRKDISGASGGPLIGHDGVIYGMIEAVSWFDPPAVGPTTVLGRSLADTALCQEST